MLTCVCFYTIQMCFILVSRFLLSRNHICVLHDIFGHINAMRNFNRAIHIFLLRTFVCVYCIRTTIKILIREQQTVRSPLCMSTCVEFGRCVYLVRCESRSLCQFENPNYNSKNHSTNNTKSTTFFSLSLSRYWPALFEYFWLIA